MDKRHEELAGMVQRGFADIAEPLDVREEVEELRKQMREVRQELNLA